MEGPLYKLLLISNFTLLNDEVIKCQNINIKVIIQLRAFSKNIVISDLVIYVYLSPCLIHEMNCTCYITRGVGGGTHELKVYLLPNGRAEEKR